MRRCRRNPSGPAVTYRVIAHGKNGEVAYRGRELHLSYGAAEAEAKIVSRRGGLTDVHIVKNGERIVGEVKARKNPSTSVSSHEAIRTAVRDADFEFSKGPLLLVNKKIDPLGGIWVIKRKDGWYEVKVPGDFSNRRMTARTPTAVADYAWGYLSGVPQTGTGPSIRRPNPTKNSSFCPCGCRGKIKDHDDRGWGPWNCPRCGQDSDADFKMACSECRKRPRLKILKGRTNPVKTFFCFPCGRRFIATTRASEANCPDCRRVCQASRMKSRANPSRGDEAMVWRILTDRDGLHTYIYVPRYVTGYQSHRHPGGPHASDYGVWIDEEAYGGYVVMDGHKEVTRFARLPEAKKYVESKVRRSNPRRRARRGR